MVVNAQYVDEEANVRKSYTVQQLVDTISTLSMDDIIEMDRAIDELRASWSRENLYAALKQLDLKWTGRYDSVDVHVKIENPKYPKRKFAKFLAKNFSEIPEYIDSVYKKEVVIGGYKEVDPDSIKAGDPYEARYDWRGRLHLEYDATIFRNNTFRISDLNLNYNSNNPNRLSRLDNSDVPNYSFDGKKEPTFTVTDKDGGKYEFELKYLNCFNPTYYIDLSEKHKEDFIKGVKPANEYTSWDCKSDFGEWYMSIYNNESLRHKLKEMQFISLMTGETVDGLQVEFEDIKKTIGGQTVIAKNAAFSAVVFPSNQTNGYAYQINREWIPSVEIDYLNALLAGLEVIKPESVSSPQIVTKIKRFIVTDKISYKDNYRVQYYLAAEMEDGNKVAIGDLSIKELQDIQVAKDDMRNSGWNWYDYKIYHETVLIPQEQREAEWEKQKAINAKQRAADLQKYTQKYGSEIAEAIVDSRVIPGMTLEIITEEMGLSYKILNSSTIIVGPGFMGELLFDMYKCVIVGNKVKLVENIMLNN